MPELPRQMDELVGLMEEFGLTSAKLAGDDWSVEFRVQDWAPRLGEPGALPPRAMAPKAKKEPKATTGPTGTPVTSPTTGIFYSSPNPGAPPFVKVGDTVEAGQVIGLIEAMKVFNEITSIISGKVQSIPVQNGQLVQPGDPLMYIG